MIQNLSAAETHHFVDDEIPGPYYTLSDFITLSGFEPERCNPSADGRSMTYEVKDVRLTGMYVQHAMVIIRVFGMQLEVGHKTELTDGRLHGFVTIQYTGK